VKRTRLRRVGRKRVSVAQLDGLARRAVFQRDGDRCVRCAATERLQWCHVYSRRFHSMRWDMDNSFVGCAGCHLWWHHKPMDSARWFASLYPRRAERLRIIAQTPRKVDKEAVRLALEAELQR